MIALYSSLNKALTTLFPDFKTVLSEAKISGGCINQCRVIEYSAGHYVFLKQNKREALDMFRSEAEGLEELKRDNGPAVPEVFALVEDKQFSGLLLEYISPNSPKKGFWEDFGRRLALLHQSGGSSSFGWKSNNYIGSTIQKNENSENWIDFFSYQRLLFQGQLARSNRSFSNSLMKNLEKLCDHLDKYLLEPDAPQPLHGDLWSGNYLCGKQQKAWIIDPAFYYGHGEADLAMTEMFGGFPESFYHAYRELQPIERGYKDRREIYNLYHYLNHLNLFGNSYLSAVNSIIQRYC